MPTSLDRHTLDRIARAVVSGRRGLGRAADRLADAAAVLMHNRLEAVGARGATRARRARGRSRALATQPPVMRRLLARTSKHLGLWAMRGAGGASPHAD